MQASKWLQTQILIDSDEMSALFDYLNLGTTVSGLKPFYIYQTSLLTKPGEEEIPQSLFLSVYKDYIDQLKNQQDPTDPLFRKVFSSVFTASSDTVYVIPFPSEKQLVRIFSPVIQLQAHQMDYFHLDHKFRSMSLGSQAISWGIQFSYPQLYENPATHQPEKVGEQCQNTELFKMLQKWIRLNTIPTPFEVNGMRINSPMRLGKKSLAWINRHPQLNLRGIQVCT